jgi:hypothetical protein
MLVGKLVTVPPETEHSLTDQEELPCFLGDDYVAVDLPPILCVRICRPAVISAASDQEVSAGLSCGDSLGLRQ